MLIGIGGPSNAGKSRLAAKIAEMFPDKNVSILCQDDYVFPKNKIPKIQEHTNWETPESIDFSKYEKAIVNHLQQFDIVIHEGIFAFYDSAITNITQKKITLTLKYDEFVKRKKSDLRWGKEPLWYINHIWASHIYYYKSNLPEGCLVIDASQRFDLQYIHNYILDI